VNLAEVLTELERLAARGLPPPSELLTRLTLAISGLVVENGELKAVLTERQIAALDTRRRLSALLKAIERNRMEMRVADVCARLGISRPTYYRLIASVSRK
jgi:transcriptional regulator of acetoin/glycerol metabolism